MNWKIAETNNIQDAIEMHNTIFEDSVGLSDFSDKGKKVLSILLGVDEFDKPAGYAIVIENEGAPNIWSFGVVKSKRRMGLGSSILEKTEKFFEQLGYQKLFINSYNHWDAMLRLLIARNYRIIGTSVSDRRSDLKIHFCKETRQKRELRYALTSKCNFNCIFCHNEGLGHESADELPEDENKTFDTLSEAVSLGYDDVTFTGGEPLLKKGRLINFISRFASSGKTPSISLVTNGLLLDDSVLECLSAYPGEKKIHFSMHATNEESFIEVTCCKKSGAFSTVIDNIRKAVSYGLKVKINHVILQDKNHFSVAEAVEMANSLGVSGIKFIELLVLPEKADNFSMFYSIEGVESEIERIAIGPELAGPRKLIYRLKENSSFIIELQKCTCALGCENCLEVRDKTVDCGLNYHPCFVRSSKSYKINGKDNLKAIMERGDRIINGYAAKYGKSSPSLVKKAEFFPDKTEFFFEVLNDDHIRSVLKKAGYSHYESKKFHEDYYRPETPSEEWLNYRKILKTGYDYHTRNRQKVLYFDMAYKRHERLGLETKTRFFRNDGPLDIGNRDTTCAFLEKLDMRLFGSIDWELEIWKNQETEVSLSKGKDLTTLRILGNDAFTEKILDDLCSGGALLKPLFAPLPEIFIS